MSKLKRAAEQWAKCDPKAMARMSEPAIMYALADAKSDVLRMHAELETLRMGYKAARLEIESLKSQVQTSISGNALRMKARDIQ